MRKGTIVADLREYGSRIIAIIILRKGVIFAMAVRVMVVDDAVFMRTVLKTMLTQNGYEVVGEAENGMRAVARYQELSPDVVTMDITMPEMDGITAVKEIKKLDAKAKIIVCSAMGQQAMIVEAVRAGAIDFIVKPLQEERVMEAIRKVTG
jgi:two-component system, chemotaxis family, chemotaxis protein CheY